MVAVEHHPEFLLGVDWLIDLGPEGGDRGGTLVVAGTPAEVMDCPASHTGAALRAAGVPPEVATDPATVALAAIRPPTMGAGQTGRQQQPGPRPAPGIVLEDVATHNLRHVNVTVPHGAITVVTGVSGSGKTSLIMDTLYAEAHRRYVESLSAYARRFVHETERPVLRAARGLTPVIAIGAAHGTPGPRSTVGTVTGCLDFLRIAMSRVGTRHCPSCASVLGGPLPGQATVAGVVAETASVPCGSSGAASNSESLVHDSRAATGMPCTRCGFVGVPTLSARLFSSNEVEGACLTCEGLGEITRCDPELLVSDPARSLLDGALDGTRTGRFYGERDGQYVATLRAVGEALGHDFSGPWAELPAAARSVALHGAGERRFSVTWQFRRGKRQGEHHLDTTWVGLATLVETEYARKRGDARGAAMQVEVMRSERCPDCAGERLRPEFRAVTVDGRSLPDLCRLPLEQLVGWGDAANPVLGPILAELRPRVQHLVDAGLGYLTLDRTTATLSGGEYRRVLLASQLGGELTGVTYLLDEPTVGLHPHDTGRLLALLRQLRDDGNTVVVIEHDADVIRAADHVIEIGPGSGADGGRVTAAGPWSDLVRRDDCVTARWLGRGDTRPEVAAGVGLCGRSDVVAANGRERAIAIAGASKYNVKNEDIVVPTAAMTVVTGVSGSGKTTLVGEVLVPSVRARRPIDCRAVAVPDNVGAVIVVDQGLPGGSEASIVATLTGLLEPVRELFARGDDARQRGLAAAAFSPFSPAGRCPVCEGMGGRTVDLDFLADVRVPCESCRGQRFNDEVLSCRWREHTIADVLTMSLRDAAQFFADQPAVIRILAPLQRLGLGHLTPGRTTASLSSGERQRVKLALALIDQSARDGASGEATQVAGMRHLTGDLLVFDEPTTGLHPADVARLLDVFCELVRAGHTLVVVEHHLDVVRRADWVIDMGPGGGDRGGRVIVAGPPATVAGCAGSLTGAALRRLPTTGGGCAAEVAP